MTYIWHLIFCPIALACDEIYFSLKGYISILLNINLKHKKMKTPLTCFATFFLTAFFIFIVSTGTYATIWTVSNNPNSPGQYTSLQMAVDSSGMGDTILVAGSSTTYGIVDIYWQLTIIGAGFHNPYGSNTIVGTIYLRNFSASVQSSGTKLSGLDFQVLSYRVAIYFNGIVLLLYNVVPYK